MKKFTGLEYIKIDIANQYGLDKLTWNERIDWVDFHDIDTLKSKVEEAEDPLLYIKGIYALEDALAGTPTGHIIGFDATASGIQIMAALMGCKTTAANVNLVNTGVREDVYQKVANIMTNQLDIKYTKDKLKIPIMTHFYGSTEEPKNVFGADTPELVAFYKTLQSELPGAMECMEDMQSCWDKNTLMHSWSLPDKHIVNIKVMVGVDKKIEIDELDHTTFTYRAYINQPSDYGKSLAANIVHSIDGYIVREMYRKAKDQGFELLTIHDSFWSSPNFSNNVRNNYRNILADIADSNLLENILNEITGAKGKLEKFSNSLGELIRSSEYALS